MEDFEIEELLELLSSYVSEHVSSDNEQEYLKFREVENHIEETLNN